MTDRSTRSARTSAAEKTSSIDLSRRDLTLDLARVFCVLLVVAIHLMMVGVGLGPDGEIVVSRPLELQPWFAPVTWAGQIMPLFFVVGGFASLTAWRSLVRRGGTGTEYVRNRVLRLAQPALPLYVFYTVALIVILLIGVDPRLVDTTVGGAGAPLWFLAAYTLCQAVVPMMVRLHARAPRATVLALLAGVILVDAARYTAEAIADDGVYSPIGLLNLFFVWVLVQQLGFFYADGWFDRRWWQLLLIPAACYGGLALLVAYGPYSPDMLDNLNPPTLPLVLLGLAQACILRLLKPVLSTLMKTTGARAVVFLAGTRLMTIYLWHLPIIVSLRGARAAHSWCLPVAREPRVVVVAHPAVRARTRRDLRAVVPRRSLGGAEGGHGGAPDWDRRARRRTHLHPEPARAAVLPRPAAGHPRQHAALGGGAHARAMARSTMICPTVASDRTLAA